MNQLNKILSWLFALITVFLAVYLKNILVLWFFLYLGILYILKLNSSLKFIAIVYGFLAVFLGFTIQLYKITVWYDTFIHFLAGIFISLIAIYILDMLNMFNRKNVIFNVIFILLFVLGISAFWEMIEFTADNVVHSDMQRMATGVYDTMKDIIAAFIGTIMFDVIFYYEYKNNHKLLLRRFINNMIGG